MAAGYRKAMDALYWICAWLAGVSLVLISAVIPYSVYTRYVVNRAASWPEPMAVLLTIVLTFIGAAACYRTGNHMSVSVLVRMLSGTRQRIAKFAAEALVAALGVFMVIYGTKLCIATWHSDIADFPTLSVGLTYLPIPIGGIITLLFVIERVLIGRPPEAIESIPEASALHSAS